MNSYIRHLILIVLITVYTPGIAYSQSSIDNLIDKLEKNPNCETTFYLESREIKTHKIITLDMKMDIKHNVLAKRLIEAFQKERNNSYSYSKQTSTGKYKNGYSYTIRFSSPDGKNSTYILTCPDTANPKFKSNVCTLVVKKSMATEVKKTVIRSKKTTRKDTKDSSYTIVPNDFDIDIDYMVIEP